MLRPRTARSLTRSPSGWPAHEREGEEQNEAGQHVPGVVEPVGKHTGGSAEKRGGDLCHGGDAQAKCADNDCPDCILVAVVRGGVSVSCAHREDSCPNPLSETTTSSMCDLIRQHAAFKGRRPARFALWTETHRAAFRRKGPSKDCAAIRLMGALSPLDSNKSSNSDHHI